MKTITIIGAGNIGTSIALGLIKSKKYKAEQITLTRRNTEALKKFKKKGFIIESDNCKAVNKSEAVIIAVEPSQVLKVIGEISGSLRKNQHIISVASSIEIASIKSTIGKPVQVARAMPNTAIAINEAITCLAASEEDRQALESATEIFKLLGSVVEIEEKLMSASTALGACGVAFFLRAIRAAAQGGIEIGFNPEVAIKIAAQAAKGAASLLLTSNNHPEYEIDKVTTPRGCTIAGLNKMEHRGFSVAMIEGITQSALKAEALGGSQKTK